jgi:hypothetical protein
MTTNTGIPVIKDKSMLGETTAIIAHKNLAKYVHFTLIPVFMLQRVPEYFVLKAITAQIEIILS